MTARAKAALAAFALALAAPATGLACPLCLAAQNEQVQNAFLHATLFMIFLPLGLIGSVVFWLRRKAKQLAAEEAAGVLRLPSPTPRTKHAA